VSGLQPRVRALVVGVTWAESGRDLRNGDVCVVTCGPFVEFVAHRGKEYTVWGVTFLDGEVGGVVEQCLVPLPPDDEAKRLFRETEHPREVLV
jgi:hypothetical protein